MKAVPLRPMRTPFPVFGLPACHCSWEEDNIIEAAFNTTYASPHLTTGMCWSSTRRQCTRRWGSIHVLILNKLDIRKRLSKVENVIWPRYVYKTRRFETCSLYLLDEAFRRSWYCVYRRHSESARCFKDQDEHRHPPENSPQTRVNSNYSKQQQK